MPSDIASPRVAPPLLQNPALLAFAARVFAWFSRWWQKPLRLFDLVIVGRHADAVDVLSRDLDFRIGPINAAETEAVNGPFIRGLDRGAILVRERPALYRALAKVDLSRLRTQIEGEAKNRI